MVSTYSPCIFLQCCHKTVVYPLAVYWIILCCCRAGSDLAARAQSVVLFLAASQGFASRHASGVGFAR